MANFILKLISRRRCTVHHLLTLRLLLRLAHLTSLKQIESLSESGNDCKKSKLLKVFQRNGCGQISTTIEATVESKLGSRKGVIPRITSSQAIRLGKISKPTHLGD